MAAARTEMALAEEPSPHPPQLKKSSTPEAWPEEAKDREGGGDLDQLRAFKAQLASSLGADPAALSEDEIVQQVRSIRASVMNPRSAKARISAMPTGVQESIGRLDKSGKGEIGADDLMHALDLQDEMAERSSFMKRVIFSMVGVLLLVFVGMFVLTYLAVDLAKEVHADGSATMRAGDGTVVKVGSADFVVGEDGSLRMATADGRRLSASDGLLATQTVKSKKLLHSALPDSFFQALSEVTVLSAKGHHLTLEIHGFARIPVLNSRCGNVVHLFTSWGPRVSLDSDDLSFDAALTSMFRNAGFEIAVGGPSGRRLSASATISGFFNHISDMAEENSWTCRDVPLPNVVSTDYVMKLRQYRPCSVATKSAESDCDSVYGGQFSGVGPLPTEHAAAMLNDVEAAKHALGMEVVKMDNNFYARNVTLMSSPSFRVQVTHYPNHPTQDHFRIIDIPDASGLDFQSMKVSGIGERFYCKAVENVTDSPEYKAAQEHDAGKSADNHFEFVGLDVVGEVYYRHFRVIPSADFKDWMEGNTGEPFKSTYHFWDNAETLEPDRLLLPDRTLWVFESFTMGVTDDDVRAALQDALHASPKAYGDAESDGDSLSENIFTYGAAIWDGSATSPCHDFEVDGVSDIADLLPAKAPELTSQLQDLEPAELAFYAELMSDESVGDDPSTSGGYRTLRQVQEGEPSTASRSTPSSPTAPR